jgi:hypothetical protein
MILNCFSGGIGKIVRDPPSCNFFAVIAVFMNVFLRYNSSIIILPSQ